MFLLHRSVLKGFGSLEGAFLCQEKVTVIIVSGKEKKDGWVKQVEVEEVYVFLMTVLLGMFVGMFVTNFIVSLVQFLIRN